MSGGVFPIDRPVGSPDSVVGMAHIVDMVATILKQARSGAVIVDHIEAETVILLESIVGGTRGAGDRTDAYLGKLPGRRPLPAVGR